MIDIALPQPLAAFVKSCAVFCQVDCCEINAFDEDAHIMLHWMRSYVKNVDEVGRQLDSLIEEVAILKDPIRVADVCYDWPNGSACADYFREWRVQYSRARAIGPNGIPPEQRLAEAFQRGRSEYAAEVYRMANEGAAAEGGAGVGAEDRRRAVGVLLALARLDPNDPGVRQEVEYARRVLKQQGQSWAALR